MTNQDAALVVGVGPVEGLGAAIAQKFAAEGLKVYIAGRTLGALENVAGHISDAGGSAQPLVMDATKEEDVTAAFETIQAEGAVLRSVIYNAGNNAMHNFLEIDTAFWERMWRLCSLGGFMVGQRAAAHMLEHGQGGSILFTGATASLRARPPFIAFASAKAAERALAHGMAREFGAKGIHVAHVIVDGVIGGDKVRENFPDYFNSLGPDGVLNIHDMAAAYWMLHSQPKSTWTMELDLRPYKENF